MSRPDSVKDGRPAEESEGDLAKLLAVGGYIPIIRETIVDFPDPDGPTMAVHFPEGIVRFKL